MGTEKIHEYAPTLGYSNREGEEGATSECLSGVCPAREKQCHILAGELVKESHSAANSMPLSSGGAYRIRYCYSEDSEAVAWRLDFEGSSRDSFDTRRPCMTHILYVPVILIIFR